jgi:hypothetical protein
MAREAIVSNQILALFEVREGEKKKSFTLDQISAQLNHLTWESIKAALNRLRGHDGVPKQIRAARYLSAVGHGGRSQPVFELGSAPDAPREEQYTQINDETIRRVKRIRNLQEERRMHKELADFY